MQHFFDTSFDTTSRLSADVRAWSRTGLIWQCPLTLQLGEEYLPSSARSSKAFCDGYAPMALTTALTETLPPSSRSRRICGTQASSS